MSGVLTAAQAASKVPAARIALTLSLYLAPYLAPYLALLLAYVRVVFYLARKAPDKSKPLAFAAVMGLSMLIYVVLDGYDLGVGVLLQRADDGAQKDTMIASIGPFWDANETWLVLGGGVLLVAFPLANGVIMGHLYLPVALMLMALILCGVAFDFRVKTQAGHKHWWDRAFYAGSLLTGWSQGFMIVFCLVAAYCLLGAGWLIMKTEGELQCKAVRRAWASLWLTALGIGAISVVTPWVSARIFDKWFSFPNLVTLLPIPFMTLVLFVLIARSLRRLPTRLAQNNQYGITVPFAGTVGIMLLAFYGLAYSLFPWPVIDQITIWQSASAPEALMVIFYGVAVVLPVILAYTVFAYRVFWGKSTALVY